MPSLTAIVPATDAPPTLQRCLDAIRAAHEPPEQLVVVDSPDRLGPAAARNAGAGRARGDVLVFVDSDVIAHPDAFSRIRRAFEADPGLTAVFGSYDDSPPAPGAVSGFRNLLHHHVHQHSPGASATFWAGLGAIRHDAFADCGGFDAERFEHASVEDIDLGLRVTRGGGKILLDPALQGTHLRRWTLPTMLWTDLVRRGRPWVAVLLRGGGTRPWRLNLGWRNRSNLVLLTLALAALATGRPLVAAGAAAVLLTANASLYRLLWRRRGPLQALAGVGLHLLHLLTALLAIPLGAVAYLRDRGREPLPSLSRPRPAQDPAAELPLHAPTREGAAGVSS